VVGNGDGRSVARDRGRKGKRRRIIYLSCLPRPSVRSFVRIWICPMWIYRESQREPFSIQSVKSTSKNHTVFHRRGRSRRDRVSSIATRQQSECLITNIGVSLCMSARSGVIQDAKIISIIIILLIVEEILFHATSIKRKRKIFIR